MTFDHDQSMVNMPLNLLSVNQSVDDANGQKEMELVSMNDDDASQGYGQEQQDQNSEDQ